MWAAGEKAIQAERNKAYCWSIHALDAFLGGAFSRFQSGQSLSHGLIQPNSTQASRCSPNGESPEPPFAIRMWVFDSLLSMDSCFGGFHVSYYLNSLKVFFRNYVGFLL